MIKGVPFLFILLVAVSLGSAQEHSNVIFEFKDASTSVDIDSVVVQATVNDKLHSHFIQGKDKFSIALPPGTYDAVFHLDDLDTSGKDYYATYSYDISSDTTVGVFVYPVGSIRGIVKDKLDNVIPNANLKFECSGAHIAQFPSQTDNFGSFSVDYMPVGDCRIFATFEEGIGISNVAISQGALAEFDIKLDTSLVTARSESNHLMYLLIVVAGGVGIWFILKRRRKTPKPAEIVKPEQDQSSPSLQKMKLGKRAQDIIATLNDREKEIVKFLADHAGASTQAKVRYGTGLPKVSVSRYVQMLEQKNIVEVKRRGKVNDIALSAWMLEQKKPDSE